MAESGEKRFVVWMGWLRVVAMWMVCLCHAGDPLAAFGEPGERIWSEIYGSFVRPCVPLFVMLTGALLLPVEESFGGMVRKRVGRVFWPFVVWSVVYAALPWALSGLGVSLEAMQKVFFPFASPVHTDLGSVGRTAVLSLIQFNQYAVPLWYVYLLVGLYLFMPVISAWLRQATVRSKGAFLGLWVAAMAVWEWPLVLEGVLQTGWGRVLFGDYAERFLGAASFDLAQTTSFDAYPILGACDWNGYGALYPFAGFVGYLVLGHVLREVKWSLRRTLCVALPLLVVGYGVVLGGTHWMWNRPGCTGKMFEFFWWYCSIPVAMMSAGVFLLVKQVAWAPRPVLWALRDFTRCGFGVFCAHYVVVTGFYYLLRGWLPVYGLLPVAAGVGFVVTWCGISLLGRLPYLRRVVG